MTENGTGRTFYTDIQKYPAVDTGDHSDYDLDATLKASSDFIPFFDIFGTMLKICKNDFEGNVTKLRKKGEEISEAKTFEALLQYELKHGLSKKSDSACIAALWYKRGLQFIMAFIEKFVNSKGDESGYELFSAAYEETLKRYHSWIVQKGILMVARMIPSRKEVVKRLCLGAEGLESKLVAEQKEYMESMKPFVNYLHNLIVDLGLDSEKKV